MSVQSNFTFSKKNRDTNEPLQHLLNNPELTIWYKDVENGTFLVSKGFAAIFGYTQEVFTDQKVLMDSVYSEDMLKIETVTIQQLKGIPTNIEYRIIRSDGEIVWIQDRATPIVNDEGKVIAISGFIVDITKHQLEINTLKSQLTRHKSMQNDHQGSSGADIILTKKLTDNDMQSEDLVPVTRQELNETIRFQQGMTFKYKLIDGDFVHTLCDGELLYRMGLTPSQVVGKRLFDFLPKEIANQKEGFYQRAWNGEEHVTYEGEQTGIFYMAALSPIKRSGEVVEVIGSCIDISDRKNAEKALLESENKYRLIADNMNDLIILFDVNGKGIYASPSHQTVLGYSPGYFEDRDTLHLIHPEEATFTFEKFEEVIQTKTPCKLELRLLHASGEWRLFECTATPVISETGLVEHVMVIAKDITEKRKAEELLWKSEKLSLVGELAAGVAHEIRNPLTSIKGFIQLFQQGFRKEEYFPVILKELSRVEDIIKEFLSLAKPQEIQLKQVKIPALLKEIETLLKSEAHLKNVEIKLEIKQKIPLVMCDQNQMKQVLLNLCKNSIEAIDRNKKGTIIISALVEENKNLLIQVMDNGIGLNEERLKRLGEPFFSNKEKGTGLGVMICFRIIKDHNGTLTFKSVENKGTTATIRLPL